MNKPFENTFDVKFDEKAMKTFNDLIKEKGIRHFKLESDLYGVLDVVLYEEYKKNEQQLDKYKNVINKIKEIINNNAFFDPAMPNCMALGQKNTLEIKKLLEEVE